MQPNHAKRNEKTRQDAKRYLTLRVDTQFTFQFAQIVVFREYHHQYCREQSEWWH